MPPLSRFSVLVLIPVVAVAAACGSEGSLSPTSPSSNGASRTAVILGRVKSVSTGATTSGEFSSMATTRLSVSIVGTNISTNVDGNGQFTLTGVPPGNVQLRFTGSGVDATITLSGVAAGDRITITVSINGRSARVDSDERDHDDENEFEVQGAVSNLMGTCPVIMFTVQGTTVKTSNATKFEDSACTRIANGTRVEVEGNRQSDGSILATEVEIDD